MSSDEESTFEESHEPWVKIQESTFANWANDKLRSHGISVNHLQKDLRDGVKLCALVESLVGHKIGRVINRKNMNYYEASGNIHMALLAVKQAGIRLVNIGAEDITRGNLKLILGLMWLLIRRFQIGSQSNLPPKKMMLAWVNAVLHPHIKVHNFSSDWIDAKALRGIIEYCAPGTFPDWMNSNVTDRLGNCEEALDAAERLFGIPLVVTANNFSSCDLDELSGMTYLSYFMMVKSPGYNATLNWIRETISPSEVNNFEEDWNDGQLVTRMVSSLGADVSCESDEPISRCEAAMSASKSQLGIDPVIDSSEMISPHVHHIGVMAYVTWHQRKLGVAKTITPVTPVYEPVVKPVTPIIKQAVEKQVKFSPVVDIPVTITESWPTLATSTIIVDTSRVGDAAISGSAFHHSTGSSINDLVISKVTEDCQHIEFTPTVKGEWKINIYYGGTELPNSPFIVNSYDVKCARLDKRMKQTNQNEYSFIVDLEEVGLDELDISVLFKDDVVEPDIIKVSKGEYKITFATTLGYGVYTVMAYCGGVKIPGSPFEVTVESENNIIASGEGLTSASTNQKSVFEVDFTSDVGKQLEVFIERPDNKGQLPINVENIKSGVMRFEYIPQEQGLHTISLIYDGVPLKDSPYQINVHVKNVKITNIDEIAYIGKKSIFQIDASEMSKGTLEIDGNLPVQKYQKIGDNIYEVTFLPKTIGTIDFTIKYNKKLLEGCPYTITVRR